MKRSFLELSITDIRDTIRALDNKMNFLIAVLIIPLSTVPEILIEITTLIKKTDGLSVLIVWSSFLSAILWLASVFFVFKGLSSISNPSDGIKADDKKGNVGSETFFSYKSYCRTIIEQLTLIPDTEAQIEFELAFEQMKLSRIRDYKIDQQKRVYCLFGLFIFMSALSVFFFLFSVV